MTPVTPAGQAEVRRLLDRYVYELAAQGAIRSAAVRRAFARVQRHMLLETFYHRPADAEPVHQRDPWPGFGATGSPSSPGCVADEIDFRFYLSLLDRRACLAPGGIGLSDGPNGWAVAGPDGIRWWKDAALVEELGRLHARWLADGRPTLEDYRVRFVPIADDAAVPPGGWVLDRRFYREHLWRVGERTRS